MDGDPQENIVDPVRRLSSLTGDNSGDAGDQASQIHQKRRKDGAELEPNEHEPVPGEQIKEWSK